MQKEKFRFSVRATDSGGPALHADVDVELDVVDRNNKPPIWERKTYGPMYVKENAQPGSKVVSVRARFVQDEKKKEMAGAPELERLLLTFVSFVSLRE